MSIWFKRPTADLCQQIHLLTMPDHIGIKFTDVGDDFLSAEMPICSKTVQPYRMMHGGASATLAETLGSVAAQMTVDPDKKRCVGLSLNISHIRGISEGRVVTGTARPFHIGRTTQVWDIQITDSHGKLASVARLTIAVLEKSGMMS